LLERKIGIGLEAVEEVDELHLDDVLLLTMFVKVFLAENVVYLLLKTLIAVVHLLL
jgi:hypothetical protein